MLTCSSTGTHVDNAVTIIKRKGYTEVTLFKTCGNLQHRGGFFIPLEMNSDQGIKEQLKDILSTKDTEGRTHQTRA